MNTQVPVYRAKSIDTNEEVVGYLSTGINCKNKKVFIINRIEDEWTFEIDPSTLAIHFPNMLASDSERLLPNGEKDLRIFASIGKGGRGGDIVEGYCRDCNGDEIITLHKPVRFLGLVRFYQETVMGVVVEVKESISISCGNSPSLTVRIGDPLRWSDCRQNIKAIGIQQ